MSTNMTTTMTLVSQTKVKTMHDRSWVAANNTHIPVAAELVGNQRKLVSSRLQGTTLFIQDVTNLAEILCCLTFYPDPNSESRLFLLNLNIYVPRDERFGHLKMSDFLGYSLKAIIEAVLPTLGTFIDDTPKEFDSFEDILGLYELGPEAPNHPIVAAIREKIPSEFIRSILPNGSHDHPLKMPLPNIIKSGN